jgi:ERCC4-type nuclease
MNANMGMNEKSHEKILLLPTIGTEAAAHLQMCGYESVEDIREADAEELMEVPYIGEQKAEFLAEHLEE